MPQNKNALHRYRILDRMLSDRSIQYTYESLLDALNIRLLEDGETGISERMLKYDLNFLESEFADCVTLLRSPIESHSKKSNSTQQMTWVRYEDPHSSIFHLPLTQEEEMLLNHTLTTLGNFDGIPTLQGLERLKTEHKVAQRTNPVVVMESRCLETNDFFGQLIAAIVNRRPVLIHHHRFAKPETIIVHKVHPVQLREYNNRWYLLGCTELEGEINKDLWNYRLDSMDKVVVLQESSFDYLEPVSEHFDEIVGVTYDPEAPCQQIVFWVSNFSKGYVETKPLHNSQMSLRSSEAELRQAYPQLAGGAFFSIECRKNYELIRDLSSFGADLLVLEPADIRQAVYERATRLGKAYRSVFEGPEKENKQNTKEQSEPPAAEESETNNKEE